MEYLNPRGLADAPKPSMSSANSSYCSESEGHTPRQSRLEVGKPWMSSSALPCPPRRACRRWPW